MKTLHRICKYAVYINNWIPAEGAENFAAILYFIGLIGCFIACHPFQGIWRFIFAFFVTCFAASILYYIALIVVGVFSVICTILLVPFCRLDEYLVKKISESDPKTIGIRYFIKKEKGTNLYHAKIL